MSTTEIISDCEDQLAKGIVMTDQDQDETYWTAEAMIEYGGGFVSALGLAARRADSDNLARIKQTWPLFWEHYRVMGRRMMENDRNNKEQF